MEESIIGPSEVSSLFIFTLNIIFVLLLLIILVQPIKTFLLNIVNEQIVEGTERDDIEKSKYDNKGV